MLRGAVEREVGYADCPDGSSACIVHPAPGCPAFRVPPLLAEPADLPGGPRPYPPQAAGTRVQPQNGSPDDLWILQRGRNSLVVDERAAQQVQRADRDCVLRADLVWNPAPGIRRIRHGGPYVLAGPLPPNHRF